MMPEEYGYCEECGDEFPASELLDGLCPDCCRALDDDTDDYETEDE